MVCWLLVDSFRMEQRVGNDVLECVSCLSWQSIRWSHDRSRQTLWCGEVWTIPHDVLRLWKGVSISVTPVYCCSFRPILVRVTIVLCAFVVSENPQLSVVLWYWYFLCCQFRPFYMAWIGYERNKIKGVGAMWCRIHLFVGGVCCCVGVSEESSLATGE